MFHVSVKFDADRALAGFEKMPGAIARNIEQWAYTVGSVVSTEAKSLAPVKTGALRGSITFELRGMQVRVGSDLVYAKYQEFGTRYIKPKYFLRGAYERKKEFVTALAQKMFVEAVGMFG
jgi:HK97 gp10 family phage protein